MARSREEAEGRRERELIPPTRIRPPRRKVRKGGGRVEIASTIPPQQLFTASLRLHCLLFAINLIIGKSGIPRCMRSHSARAPCPYNDHLSIPCGANRCATVHTVKAWTKVARHLKTSRCRFFDILTLLRLK